MVQIGNNEFQSCDRISRVTLANGIEKIGNFAFGTTTSQNTSLKEVVVPSTVTSFGTQMFMNCVNAVVYYPESGTMGNNIKTKVKYAVNDDGKTVTIVSVTGTGLEKTPESVDGKKVSAVPEEYRPEGKHFHYYGINSDAAFCSICEAFNPDHTHSGQHVPAKNPTILSTGNIEYWYCADCDTCFADEALTIEIDPASVILAQLPKPLATEYYLNFAVEEHGSVTPGSGMYAIGSKQTFTIRPDSGYVVDAVLVDGKEVSVHNNQFTLTVDAPYRITVRFAEAATAGTPSIDVGGSGSTTTATPNPQTGDNSLLAFAILLLGSALFLTAGLLRRQTKANR